MVRQAAARVPVKTFRSCSPTAPPRATRASCASAPAPSTFAPAGSTPATSPAPAVVAKTEMSAADVSKVGSGLVRGRKRTRREVPTVGLPVGPTKAAQEAQKKKKPLPPLDVPLENKFTVDVGHTPLTIVMSADFRIQAAGEMCALSMPVAWRDELMRVSTTFLMKILTFADKSLQKTEMVRFVSLTRMSL